MGLQWKIYIPDIRSLKGEEIEGRAEKVLKEITSVISTNLVKKKKRHKPTDSRRWVNPMQDKLREIPTNTQHSQISKSLRLRQILEAMKKMTPYFYRKTVKMPYFLQEPWRTEGSDTFFKCWEKILSMPNPILSEIILQEWRKIKTSSDKLNKKNLSPTLKQWLKKFQPEMKNDIENRKIEKKDQWNKKPVLWKKNDCWQRQKEKSKKLQ